MKNYEQYPFFGCKIHQKFFWLFVVVNFNKVKIRIKVQNKITDKGYPDIKGKRNLCFTERKSPYEEVSLEDED